MKKITRAAICGCAFAFLCAASADAQDAVELNEAERKKIQQGLKGRGFDPGEADGVFGENTRTAIHGWQRARKPRADRVLGSSDG